MGSVFNRGTRDRPLWYGKYKDETGRWKMVPTHQPTKVQARRWVEEIEERVSKGKVGIEGPKQEKTFAEAMAYWLETHSETALASHDDNVGRSKPLLESFGPLPLSEISAQRVDAWRAWAKRQTKVEAKKTVPRWAVATINRMLALLRKVLNDSARWGWITAAPKVKLLPQPEQPFVYLDKTEAQLFLSWTKEHAPEDFPLYAAAIYTGARMGELYGLRWSTVSLERAQMTIQASYDNPYTNGKKIRSVRLNFELVAILKDWKRVCPKGELDLVFPVADGTMRPKEKPPLRFDKNVTGSGVKDITFHDLRHTAASLMVMAGVSLRAVQKILGHASITTTERYAHLAPDFMASEADRLSLDLGSRGKLIAMT